MRTTFARHGADESDDLATVDGCFFGLVDASFVSNGEFPARAVEGFFSCQALDFGEGGQGVEGDEVVED